MTPCIDCKHLKLKNYPEHVRIGWGRCGAKECATFVQIGRDIQCSDFKAESSDKIISRREWWAKQGE